MYSQTPSRTYYFPGDKRIEDQPPTDSVSCLKFSPQPRVVDAQAPQQMGFGQQVDNRKEILACGSWDGMVRFYAMDRVSIDPLNPGAPNTDLTKLDDRFHCSPNFPYSFQHQSTVGAEVPAVKFLGSYSHGAPVLDISWSKASPLSLHEPTSITDGSKLFSGGCDGSVRMFSMDNGQAVPIPGLDHGAPIKCVLAFSIGDTEILASASWNKLLKFTTVGSILTGSPQIVHHELMNRPISISANKRMLVLATSERMIYSWDFAYGINVLYQDPRSFADPNYILDPSVAHVQVNESPLRWQTRTIRCVSDKQNDQAYAIGSIEGRVAIQFPFLKKQSVQPTPDPNFSFKCHRQNLDLTKHNPDGVIKPNPPVPVKYDNKNQPSHLYSVNVIEFNQMTETFVSAGSDGGMTFWDGVKRSKLKAYTSPELDERPKPVIIKRETRPSSSYKAPTEYTVGYTPANPNINSRIPEEQKLASDYQAQEQAAKAAADANFGLKVGMPITAFAFNSDCTVAVYARSYDWSMGHAHAPPVDANGNLLDPATAPRLMIHVMQRQDTHKIDANKLQF